MINNEDEWHLTYFSRYLKTIRMFGWMFRFSYNARHLEKRTGFLTAEEIDAAEQVVLKIVQQSQFTKDDQRLKCLDIFCDKDGLIRLKTRLVNKKDSYHFRMPILLPSHHVLVDKLVMNTHEKTCHAGVQGLMSILRERYWILGGRRYIRSIVTKCVICKRHGAKPLNVKTPALPAERVGDAVAFEVIDVGLAGPLYLKGGDNVWICLFTFAVYRAVHLELANSLSAACFMKAFRRFVSRRGRPKIVYSDNGTNFVGTENLLRKLDWDCSGKSFAAERIIWKFNPPTASWWGGFWERLIGLLKQLLRKTLGRAHLSYEDLLTLLCECEDVMNSRPLTYISNNANELSVLSPSM